METESDFTIVNVGNEVVLEQKIVKRFSVEESIKEFSKLGQESMQLTNQISQMQSALDENRLEKDLEAAKKNLGVLDKLSNSWAELNKPLMKELEDKVIKKVGVLKAKTGYGRIKEANAKMVKASSILSEVCVDMGLDRAHPVVQSVRAKFDKI